MLRRTAVGRMGSGIPFWGAVLLPAALGAGCDGTSPTDLADLDPVALVDNALSGAWPSDAVQLTGHRITGDTLELDVSYSGGCADHLFRLLITRGFAESFPVQTWGVLAHDDGDDPCDSIVSGTLVFDLSPLRAEYRAGYGPGNGEIVLHIQDLTDSVRYLF